MSDFSKRLMTTIVTIPLVLAWLLVGKLFQSHWLIAAMAIGVAGIAAWEYTQMLQRNGILLHRWLFIASVAGVMLVYSFFQGPEGDLGLWAACILSIVAYLFDPDALRKTIAALGGLIYIPYLLHFFYPIYQAPGGLLYGVLALMMVWAYDIGAYLVGSIWGVHKLAPSISPKKSWEGLIGGFLLTFATVSTLPVWGGWVHSLSSEAVEPLGEQFWYGGPSALWHMLALAAIVSFFTQLGDLVESHMKRFAQVKDAGGLMPGHGGLLDRIDGLLFALPAIYFYLHFVLKLV
jgi:phosphatidate cytidylyltransferase